MGLQLTVATFGPVQIPPPLCSQGWPVLLTCAHISRDSRYLVLLIHGKEILIWAACLYQLFHEPLLSRLCFNI